jgi:hypothetical protein
LLKMDDPLERSSYEQQSANERWSVRELAPHLEPAQGRVVGRVRHLQPQQPALCPELQALFARARITAAGTGADAAGGRE